MMTINWREKDEMTVTGTSWRNSLGSLFQRRGEAWRKERLLTFRGGIRRWTGMGDNIRGTSAAKWLKRDHRS